MKKMRKSASKIVLIMFIGLLVILPFSNSWVEAGHGPAGTLLWD